MKMYQCDHVILQLQVVLAGCMEDKVQQDQQEEEVGQYLGSSERERYCVCSSVHVTACKTFSWAQQELGGLRITVVIESVKQKSVVWRSCYLNFLCDKSVRKHWQIPRMSYTVLWLQFLPVAAQRWWLSSWKSSSDNSSKSRPGCRAVKAEPWVDFPLWYHDDLQWEKERDMELNLYWWSGSNEGPKYNPVM